MQTGFQLCDFRPMRGAAIRGSIDPGACYRPPVWAATAGGGLNRRKLWCNFQSVRDRIILRSLNLPIERIQPVKIETGLFASMVLQRNARHVSEALITGTAEGCGVVEVRVKRKSKVLQDWNWKKIGTAADGRFEARLAGVPVGGPYSIKLRIGASEAAKVADVLVGDVWIAAGQSNMEGCGEIQWREKPHAMVRAFYMNDEWAVAEEQITNRWVCVDQVHVDLNSGVRPQQNPVIGNSPAVSFGQELYRLAKVPVGLLACAHGGTSMAQWSPELKSQEGKSLYGAMVRRVKKNGGKVAGMIWYQGESDTAPETAAVYTQKMQEFVAAARKDCGNPQMPIIGVQIGRFPNAGDPTGWNSVQDQERRLATVIRNCSFVPAIDLPLDDGIHIGRDGPNRLGRRMAQAAYTMAGGKGALPLPIDVKGVSLQADKARGRESVVVEFENVVGKLVVGKGERVGGFSVLNSDGGPQLFDVRLEGNKAILRTGLQGLDAQGATVSYGAGMDPHCNVRDEAGRALPVFGPVKTGTAQPLTAFVRKWQVSAFQAGAGQLHELAYPAADLKYTEQVFTDRFASMRPAIARHPDEDLLLYYRTQIEVPDVMALTAMIGYDGPVKMWLDGKQVLHDPNGTNPALADQREIPLDVAPGRHEVLVALGTNGGRAWGIFLRFRRTDVSRKQLKAGGYAMPKLGG